MLCLSGKVVLPTGVMEGHVLVEGTTIHSVLEKGSTLPPNAQVVPTAYIIPGFVDIHNHGMGGAEEMLHFWGNPDHTCRLLARRGTTSVLASVTFPDDRPELTKEIIALMNSLAGQYKRDHAVIEGIHAEGPIVADLGGLPQSEADMKLEDFKELVDTMPSLRVMTIAPSKDVDGYHKMKYLISKDVTPALGHDRTCTTEQIVGAIRACAPRLPHVTHLFNVNSFHHRDSSLVNFGLVNRFPKEDIYDGLHPPTVELIGDGNHVSTLTAQCVFTIRKPEHVALITDCMGDCQQKGLDFLSNSRPITIDDTGTAVIKGTNTLTGSTATLWQVFQRALHRNGIKLVDAVRMACTTPAEVARLSHVGSIVQGKMANLLLLSEDLRTLEGVYIHGDKITDVETGQC